MKNNEFKQMIDEIRKIKMLLALLALKNKASQREVGAVLGITDRQLRNLLSGKHQK